LRAEPWSVIVCPGLDAKDRHHGRTGWQEKNNRMARKLTGTVLSLWHRRTLRLWQRLERRAYTVNLGRLRQLRTMAQGLRNPVNRVIHIADGRLTLPALGSNAMRLPPQTDWSCRPEVWSGPVTPTGVAGLASEAGIGSETTLFHDCRLCEISMRQVRNAGAEDLSPFGLKLEIFHFEGSFLSLAIEAPQSAIQGLRKSHLVRLDLKLAAERALEIYARLNLKQGPNTVQIVRKLDLDADRIWAEFDLDNTKFNQNRAEQMWVDLIFDHPGMNQVTISDLTLSRRPRANL